jgi:hypothetical protein
MGLVRASIFRTVATVAVVSTAVLGPASPVAAQPLSGSGTATITRLEVETVREAGGNVTEIRQLAGTVEGAIEGTFVETVTGVVHKSGMVTFHGTMTFTGTVQGCGEGTFTVGVTGRAQSGVPTGEGTFRAIDQASNTLPITGTGTLQQTGPSIDYEVRYTCR